MDKMRNVNVVVEPGTNDESGNGLGNIVLQSNTASAVHSAHHPDIASKRHPRQKNRGDAVSVNHTQHRMDGLINIAMMTLITAAVGIGRYRRRRR
jgi:hypothetical protein